MNRKVLADRMMPDSVGYYDNHAMEFFRNSIDVDASSLYAPFLVRMPESARILDAGCGSGRDALAFSRLGHDVIAFDGSSELAALASRHTGLEVQVLRFGEVSFVEAFDGIWACASLLHVPRVELSETVEILSRALRSGGVFYLSFKEGQGEQNRGGRLFTNLDESDLVDLIKESPTLDLLETWLTADVRPEREGEYWVNALAQAK